MQNEFQSGKCVSLVVIRIEIDDLNQVNLNENLKNVNFNQKFEYSSPAYLNKQEPPIIVQQKHPKITDGFLNLSLDENNPEAIKQFIGNRQSQLIQIETYQIKTPLMQNNNPNSNFQTSNVSQKIECKYSSFKIHFGVNFLCFNVKLFE